MKIHGIINHPNVLKLFGYYQDDHYFYLLLEYAPEGEIGQL